MSNYKNLLTFSLLAALWGGSFVAIKMVVDKMPFLLGATFRVFIAFLCIALFMHWRGQAVRLAWRDLWRVWVVGALSLGLPFALLFWGEQRVSAGLAGIINGTVPIWTFLLGAIFLPKADDFSPRKFLGLAVGISGLTVLFRPYLTFTGSQDEFWGLIAITGMAISYAVGALSNRLLLTGEKKVPMPALLYHQQLGGLVLLLIFVLLSGQGNTLAEIPRTWNVWVPLIYLAVFSTAIAMVLFNALLRDWGVVKAASVTYVIPIMGLFWDYVFFQHVPRRSEWVGASIILFGVFLVQYPVHSAAGAFRDKVRKRLARSLVNSTVKENI